MKKLSLNLLSLTLLCTACFPEIREAQKDVVPFHPPGALETFEDGEMEIPDEGEFFGSSVVDSQACEYVNLLRADQARNRRAPFRIFESIVVTPAYRRSPETIKGYHNLSKNPQVLYVLSGESNPTGKPLDPPTLEQFIKLAEEKYAKGEVSWGEVKILKILKSVRAEKTLAKLRNSAVQSAVEEALPGAFSATPMDLSKSNLLAAYFQVSSTVKSFAEMNASEKAALQVLTYELPLQVATSPSARLNDLKATLKLLYAESDLTGAERTKDELCRFALSQRLTAQILTEKGFHRSPRLERGGFLIQEYPQVDVWTYPEQEVAGIYSEILDSVTIGRLLATGQSLRPTNATGTEGYLSSMRAIVTKMALIRAPKLWGAQSEGAPALINPKLIQLQFGQFALQAPLLSAEELTILPENRLALREDSLEAILELGNLGLDLLWTLKGLEDPIPAIRDLLSEAQINALVGDSDESVQTKFETLITGIILELNARVSENEYSEQEKFEISKVYIRAARQLGNPILMRKGLRLRAPSQRD